MTIHWQEWVKSVEDQKKEEEALAKLEEAEGKMNEWQKRKKEEAKAVMARVAQGNDNGLKDTCITAWYRIMNEEKAAKEAEARLMEAEGKMTEWQKRKKEEAKAVMARVAA